MGILHWLVYHAWPVIGYLSIFAGILFALLALFLGEDRLEIVLGVSCIVFGLWIKGVNQYSPYTIPHGGLIKEFWGILTKNSSLVSSLESHWIIFGLIPTSVLAFYWYLKKGESDAVSFFTRIASVTTLITLIITLAWMYYAPHVPHLSPAGL